MELTYETLKKIGNPSLYLCNPNQDELQPIIPETANVTLRLNDISELTLTVNKYISSNNVHQRVEQPCFNLLESKRLIKVDHIGWFEITNVSDNENEGGAIKTITAHSHQSIFRNKGFYVEDRVYKFYNVEDPYDENYNASNISATPSVCGQLAKQLGIKLDLNENEIFPTKDYSDWTLIYIDNDLRFNQDKIYRTLKSETTNGYDFMVNTVEKAFEVLFLFDILTHTIKVKYIKSITEPTDIYLSYDNLIQSIETVENADNIVTVLNCNGGNDLNISTVNPMGTNYIVNFDYYKNTQWMSQELIDVLDQWKEIYDSKVEEFTNLVLELQESYKKITDLDAKITYEELKIKDLSDGRDLYITESPAKLETFIVGEKSSYTSSPFQSNALTGNETYTCYSKAYKYENDKFVTQGVSSKNTLSQCFDSGYKFFVDIDTSSYCKLIKDDEGNLGIERYGVFTKDTAELCVLNENSQAIITCENVSIGETSLYGASKYASESFAKNSNKIFTCYKKPYIAGCDLSNATEYMSGTLDECGNNEYYYFQDPAIMGDYMPIEYLESFGAQYINTNHYVTSNSKIIMDVEILNTDVIMATSVGSIDDQLSLEAYWVAESDYVYCMSGLHNAFYGNAAGGVILHKNKRYTNTIYNGGVSWLDPYDEDFYRGGQRPKANTGLASTVPIFLFAKNMNGTADRFFTGRIYYCKIYENDILVKDFIPAIRMSDNTLGMYDRISGEFCVNQGTGNFTSDVTTASDALGTYCKINMSAEIDAELTGAAYYASGFTRYTTIDNASTWINKHDNYLLSLTNFKQTEQNKINTISKQMQEISEVCNVQKYVKSKDASGNLYKELECYWIEGDYSNDTFALTDDMALAQSIDLSLQLKEVGEQQIKRVSQPTFTFNINSLDFLKIKEFQKFAEQLELGKTICVEKSENLLYQPAITEITFNLFNADEFSMTFSNSAKLNGNEFTFADLVAESSSVSKSVSSNWQDLLSYSKEKENLNSIITDPLNRALRAGMGGAINQEFIIDNTGILGRKYSDNDHTSFLNEQIRIINNTILFTDDNWNSVKTALGKIYYTNEGEEKSAYGLVAETIIGNLIMGDALKVKNNDSTILIDQDGISIKDKTNKILFNANTSGDVNIIGCVNALSGYIGTEKDGFLIDSNSISHSLDDEDKRVFISTGSFGTYKVHNSSSQTGWMLIAGSNFGVTNQGELFASRGSIAGMHMEVNSTTNSGVTVDTNKLYSDRFTLGTMIFSDNTSDYSYIKCWDASHNEDNPNTRLDVNGVWGKGGYFDELSATTLDVASTINTQKVAFGELRIADNAIRYGANDSTVSGLFFGGKYNGGSAYTTYTAELTLFAGGGMLSNPCFRVQLYGSSGGVIAAVEDITLTVYYCGIGGDQKSVKVYIPKGADSATADGDTVFWGLDYYSFSSSSTNARILMFSQGSSSGGDYIGVVGHLAPYYTNTYTLGTSLSHWQSGYISTVHAVTVNQSSDRRIKHDISPVDDKLSHFFDLLQPSIFKFNDDVEVSDKTHIGLIAQDVGDALESSGLKKELYSVFNSEVDADGNEKLSLHYTEFISLNIYEIQKLKKRVAELESKLQKYEMQEG